MFDLPQLYQKPSLDVLHAVLWLLDSPPSTFGVSSTTSSDGPSIHPEGITNYLTKIISSSLSWLPSDDDRETILDIASQRLSQRSGRTAMANIIRHFTVPLSQDHNEDISIEIYEPALTEDNLGLKTWSSSYVLAKKLHILSSHVPLSDMLPILELGAGTGLVGLAAAAAWSATVVLTDLPAIVQNLARNVTGNAGIVSARGGSAIAGTLDWTQPDILTPFVDVDVSSTRCFSSFLEASPHPKVQTILAADSIYSPDHPAMLVNAVSSWLAPGGDARLILAYPIREAYLPQIAGLRCRLGEMGLVIHLEEAEMSQDDWAAEVEVHWSVWRRSG